MNAILWSKKKNHHSHFSVPWCGIRASVSDRRDLFSGVRFQTSTISCTYIAIFAAVFWFFIYIYHSLFHGLEYLPLLGFTWVYPYSCLHNVCNIFHIQCILSHLYQYLVTNCHFRFRGSIAFLHKYPFCSFLSFDLNIHENQSRGKKN
jgi:hypothetical protein